MKTKVLYLLSIISLLSGCSFGGDEEKNSSSSPEENDPPSTECQHEDPDGNGYCNLCGALINPPQRETIDFIPKQGEVRLLFNYVDRDGHENYYNYCPTSFVEDNKQHIYYCTNKLNQNITDYVGYRSATIENNNIKFSDNKIVVEPATPGSGLWDSRHTCDPSVIKGEFKYHGTSYKYLMAFLGCISNDCTLNETGIAVANSPEGPWVKCDSVNPIVPHTEFNCVNGSSLSWGTGQPSLVSVDGKGKVLLFTTVGSLTGTFTNLREYDFSDIDNFVKIRERREIQKGGIKYFNSTGNVINNADYAYDNVNKRIIMVKERLPFGLDGKAPTFIGDTLDVYYIDDTEGTSPGDVLFAGNNTTKQWKLIGTIDKSVTGLARNHNPGLITDPYGYLLNQKTLGVLVTKSDLCERDNDWIQLSSYDIYATGLDLPDSYFPKK